MNNTLILISILILVVFLTRRESFTEIFGMSGYKKPIENIRLDDPVFDKEGYVEVDASVDSDTIEKLVLNTNSEISRRLGICTYIIETTALKHYKIKEDAEAIDNVKSDIKEMKERAKILEMMGDVSKIQEIKREIEKKMKKYNDLVNINDVYECMFMIVKDSGFSFGFSVVSTIQIKNGITRVMSLRSQPIDSQVPSNITPYIESRGGQDFVDYDIIDELNVIKSGEFEMAKNKLM